MSRKRSRGLVQTQGETCKQTVTSLGSPERRDFYSGGDCMDGRDYDPNTFGFMPPKPGACPVCAYNHGLNEPHFPGSAYYIMRFYRRHNGPNPAPDPGALHQKSAG